MALLALSAPAMTAATLRLLLARAIKTHHRRYPGTVSAVDAALALAQEGRG